VCAPAQPEGVLLGHVRALVLAACRAAGLPVRLEAPSLADAGRWRGCFLTSTVRSVCCPRAALVGDQLCE
jgi:branched-subunit amino acid aminotransferase/4-amino-4-deoxychorismate lyase